MDSTIEIIFLKMALCTFVIKHSSISGDTTFPVLLDLTEVPIYY